MAENQGMMAQAFGSNVRVTTVPMQKPPSLVKANQKIPAFNNSQKGWRQESTRHALARKGIKTGNKKNGKKAIVRFIKKEAGVVGRFAKKEADIVKEKVREKLEAIRIGKEKARERREIAKQAVEIPMEKPPEEIIEQVPEEITEQVPEEIPEKVPEESPFSMLKEEEKKQSFGGLLKGILVEELGEVKFELGSIFGEIIQEEKEMLAESRVSLFPNLKELRK